MTDRFETALSDASPASEIDPKNFTLLIVDDEDDMRETMCLDFQRQGFNILEAKNGLDAFELFLTKKIDLIITDQKMPDGDGILLLERIKDVSPMLPVVMFSGSELPVDHDEAYDKGADAIFPKPFDRKALLAKVKQAISNRDDNWRVRDTGRVEAKFDLKMVFPELQSAVTGQVLNIGRGGVFVRMEGPFPNVGSTASFSIKFDRGDVHELQGSGIVRWVRTESADDMPAGCGIEFTSLSDSSRQEIIEYLKWSRTKSFIPKN
jgi:CheY-like chemotaxis protein